jgi:hypothetical protein
MAMRGERPVAEANEVRQLRERLELMLSQDLVKEEAIRELTQELGQVNSESIEARRRQADPAAEREHLELVRPSPNRSPKLTVNPTHIPFRVYLERMLSCVPPASRCGPRRHTLPADIPSPAEVTFSRHLLHVAWPSVWHGGLDVRSPRSL